MASGGADLPADVEEFLRRAITSYEHLELLLLLHHRADGWLTATEAADALRLAPAAVEEALNHLGGENLLDVRVGEHRMAFHYAPGTPALARTIDALATAWRDRRDHVTTLMARHAIERVRARALGTFADAFVFGRGKKDG